MKLFSKFSVLLLGAVLLFGFASCQHETSSVVTYIGTKAPNVAKEVGDIVFNDGSTMPYAAFTALTDEEKDTKKTSAIALIFYKGTGLNSDDAKGNADNTTSRTLGVGLKHNRSGLAWCKYRVNAYDKNITTIQCPASGSSRALTFTGDKNGSDNLEQIEAFDEVDDTATATNYPAFYFAKNYKEQTIGSETVSRIPAGSEFENGWYLPSIAELFQIYACRADATNGFDIDAASSALGGDNFGTSGYWSSSQDASKDNSACRFNFNYGECGSVDKAWDGNNSYVCAIRAFN